MLLGCLGAARAQVTTQNPASEATAANKMSLTLEECVQIALQNNPQIKQAGLQVAANENNLIQSKWQRWPNLGFSASQGFSFGRNIDPFTNQFVQRNISFNNFGLNAGATLYNGSQLQNNIKQNDLTLKASEKDLAATRNDIMLNVALAYLNILSNRELIEVARQQGAATQLQLDRTQRLVDAGSLAESQLFDLRAQLANDELSLVNAENNLESSKLQLKQLMNLPGSETIDVQAIDAPDPALRAYENTVNEVFDTALQNLPQMEAAKLRVQSAGAAIEIVKAQGLPSLSISGGINTQFSSAAPKTRFVGDGSQGTTQEVVSQTRYVVVGDETLPITEVVQVPGGSLQTFNYLDQLNFNRNSSLQLSLRVPIFSNFQTKYRVANARIQQQNLEQQANIVTQQIRQTWSRLSSI